MWYRLKSNNYYDKIQKINLVILLKGEVMKIYIMGSTGIGKTTLAKSLSKSYNIKYYELDKIVYEQKHLEVHRKDE